MHDLGAVSRRWLLVGVLLAGGCTRAPPDTQTRVPEAEYVGSTGCAGCHAVETERWRGSHHDLAMQVCNPATVLGDFRDVRRDHHGVATSFSMRDGRYYVTTDGPTGGTETYRVTHTFGVDPLQQYLVEFDGGRYQALPWAWDTRPATAGGQRWFHLYPDEPLPPDDPLHWTSPNQNWNYMCAECHSTNLKRGYDPETDRYETTYSEIDVACEACHGPGSSHVAWAEARSAKTTHTSGDDVGLLTTLADHDGGWWVIDAQTSTAKRTPERKSREQIEACARCHSRRSNLTASYVHGRPLLDTHRPSLLEARLYHADGQILDEVYVYGSFIQSRMYHAGVNCTDCHDPHTTELIAPGNALCGRCHDATRFDTPTHHGHVFEGRAMACVTCHMPSRTYMVVDDRHDHAFGVPRPELSAKYGTPDVCTGCHDERSATWAATQIISWRGSRTPPSGHFTPALAAARAGHRDAGDLLAGLVRDAEQPAIARATALTALEPTAATTPGLLRHAAVDPDPLVRRSVARLLHDVPLETRRPLAMALLDDPVLGVRVEAARALVTLLDDSVARRSPLTATERMAITSGVEALLATERTNIERPEALLNIGLIELERGRYEAAKLACEAALRLDAGFVPARANLADLYRLLGRDDLGEQVLVAGLELAPNDATLTHALGLLMIRTGRHDLAIDALARAAIGEPHRARFSYVYALALHERGATSEAIGVLERSLQLHPADQELLTALATICRDAGRIGEARDYARMLLSLRPDDPAVIALLRQIEGG